MLEYKCNHRNVRENPLALAMGSSQAGGVLEKSTKRSHKPQALAQSDLMALLDEMRLE